MMPKVEACLTAIKEEQKAHIIDGRFEHSLLLEIYTDKESERRSSNKKEDSRGEKIMNTQEVIELFNQCMSETTADCRK